MIAPHPETRSRLDEVQALEAALPWPELVAEAAAGAERTVLRPDSEA